MTSLEQLEHLCINETTLHLASNLNLDELDQLADHFKAKRVALIEAKEKVSGLALQEINTELQLVKARLTKTNQAISMLKVSIKEQKAQCKSDPHFTTRFYEEAQKLLPDDLFEKIKKKAKSK